MSRGGARPGSGPKSRGEANRVSLCARVDRKTMERLRQLQGQDGLGVTLDRIVAGYGRQAIPDPENPSPAVE